MHQNNTHNKKYKTLILNLIFCDKIQLVSFLSEGLGIPLIKARKFAWIITSDVFN